ncbi:hypothetical protein acsn021_03750 [Anaerocolumna cellulosilytica]|uniref:Uncharacterized protein n=1 Tax=Anaerocolumna cellulosilytica TaxID=433286 RepID=A0A6S6QT37_9FIRM|nr:glycoside hydrolase [Anaerocolumna cellulosilytica]MBB5197364.1 hypothetical protein [Anaerocolumna cellulosilytica]BCJ92806.1 hypothetical protein acsn021_03750 [Anaerocolumna cellulosilytica]
MHNIERVRQGEADNYFYPFFWQHGEKEEILREYVNKIAGCGMKAVCIESRPHPDFVGEKWWKDLGIIIDEAKRNNMKLWILDDAHFPTGYANGKIKEEYPELKKWYLDMRRYDVAGPVKGARIHIALLNGKVWDKPSEDINHVIGVYAAKRESNRNTEDDAVAFDSFMELEGALKNGIITWDIPEGSYSIFTVFYTRNGGEEATKDYLNPLVADAARVLLKEVYEPHYEHLKEEFGKTILGFFSDEPRFGNTKGAQAAIGCDMVLPWRLGLEEELPFENKYLPLLWAKAGGKEGDIRHQYMDLITKMYRDNFTGVLSEWCQNHQVLYLGHNIEDNGAHARLGYGTGHFFRGQEGQHLSGIDVIGTQIVPGMPYHHNAFSTGGSDGEFYHFALAKLGSSAAHLEPHKEGRAMCEAFGAYGWNAGLSLMKWISDHLIVRGINYLVPHAFNPAPFPDWDCPPHFDAHGYNPQFRYFKTYSDYTNRLMNLFQKGVHKAPAAVLYPAEQEWAGAYMPVEKPVRELMEHQIDCDIVSPDYLINARMAEGNLIIHKEAFQVLIVPYGEAIPATTARYLVEYAKKGLRVIFVEAYPDKTVSGSLEAEEWEELKCFCRISTLEELALACADLAEIKLETPCKDLVYYHYEQGEMQYWMFFNEHISSAVNSTISMKETGYAYRYDAFTNEMYELIGCKGSYELKLSPYESCIWIFSEKPLQGVKKEKGSIDELKPCDIESPWKVQFADSFSYPLFTEGVNQTKAEPIQNIIGYEDKTGTVSYETVLTDSRQEGRAYLKLKRAYEVAEVFVNGVSAGVKICQPYVFELTGLLTKEENTLRIEVTNTLGTQVRDGISHYLIIEPFGVEGPVTLYTE